MITIAAIMNGNKKCKAKNRLCVALSEANPPQSHRTKSIPLYKE